MMRKIWKVCFTALLFLALAQTGFGQQRGVNIVLIVADDLGYGDLSGYGNRKIKTENIDRLASEGVRLTDFYAPTPNCTPSRASLQTGRYPFRSKLDNVVVPKSNFGLPSDEITVGEALQGAGYKTAYVGKWHLGHRPQFFPTRNGYDEFFGLMYSNDMKPVELWENERVVETRVDQAFLTRRYTTRADAFIRRNKNTSFFLTLAHAMPHKPLAVSPGFADKSKVDLYQDALLELDWSVGEIRRTLKELGLEQNTLILFTSDNGAWYGGSNGNLRGMKNTAFEGGLRVPLIAFWQNRLPRNKTVRAIATMCDIFPTILAAAKISPPADREIDGKDLLPLLKGRKKNVHKAVFAFHRGELRAVRAGKWRLVIADPDPGNWEGKSYKPGDPYVDPDAPDDVSIIALIEGQAHGSQYPGVRGAPFDGLALYDLEKDAGEQTNVAAKFPKVVKRLQKLADAMQVEMKKARGK